MNNRRYEVQEIIERAQMEFANDTRSCIITKRIPELTIAGKKVGPFSKSTKTRFPNWVIGLLQRHGFIELEQDDNYDSLHNIQRIYGNEDDRTGLQPIHALLYAAISRKLFKLRSKRASLDPKQYDEIEKLKRLLLIISQKRLPKILRVALSGAYKDKRNEMTLEERWLCEELSMIISEWKKNLFL